MADLVMVMKDGVIQQAGAPMDIYHNPANAFVAGFIGTTNLMPCTVAGGMIEVLGHKLPVAEGDRIGVPSGPAQLSIRPEHVTLTAEAEGIPAEVSFVRDLGESRHVLVLAEGQEITAQMPPGTGAAALRPGDRVGLSFRPGQRVVVA